MTLIEFTIAAKKIIDDAGLGPCTVTCGSDMRIGADGKIEYQHKVTAHPASGMLTSWQEPSSYSCNNPTLALERLQIAVDRRLAPPSEPEAITEIEADAVGSETVYMLEKPETPSNTKGEFGLTIEQAISLLPETEKIHTFRRTALMILGCDMDRNDLIEKIKEFDNVELSGEHATSMNHGAFLEDNTGALFFETCPDALAKIEKAIAPQPESEVDNA